MWEGNLKYFSINKWMKTLSTDYRKLVQESINKEIECRKSNRGYLFVHQDSGTDLMFASPGYAFELITESGCWDFEYPNDAEYLKELEDMFYGCDCVAVNG